MEKKIKEFKELLTLEEVASILRLRPSTIKKYLRTGKLVGAKFGNFWRVDPDDLRQFIDSRKSRPDDKREAMATPAMKLNKSKNKSKVKKK